MLPSLAPSIILCYGSVVPLIQLDQLTRRSFEVGRGSSLELVQSAQALRQADVVLATREFELVQARLDSLLTEASCDW